MKALLRHFLYRLGYDIRRQPRYLLQHPQSAYEPGLPDMLARAILSRHDPFFLQIGAYDGMANDPIHAFLGRNGLSGILVEPQPNVFTQLEKSCAGLPDVHLVNAAVGASEGELELFRLKEEYLYLGGDVARQITSPYREKIESFISWESDTDEVIESLRVPCYTVSSLLAQYNRNTLDLLLIDTEGHDLVILQAADLPKLRPTLVLYEHKHLNPSDQQTGWDLLRGLGYHLHIHWEDTIAILPERLSE